MPTEISPRTRQIATEELERYKRMEAELAALKKKQPPPRQPVGQWRLSQFHDYEAYFTFFKKDDNGKPIKDQKGFYEFDAEMPRLYMNTVSFEDLRSLKAKSVTVYEELPREE